MQPEKRKKILLILAAAAGLIAGYFIYQYMTYVSTDNATIQAHTVMLSTRVSGIVQKVMVEENQKVKAGDLLAVLDSRDYENAAAQADAELGSLEVKRDDAERNYKRLYRLLKEDAVSRQQFEDAQAKFKEQDEKIKSIKASLDQAKLNLSYTKIAAPSDGTIARKSVEIGMFVPTGTPLFGFVEAKERWVTANFKETDLEHIKIGSHATVTVDAVPGRKFEGEVESFSPSTGATFALLPPDNATGNFTKVVQRVPIKIKLLNLNDNDRDRLQAGLSAIVSVHRR